MSTKCTQNSYIFYTHQWGTGILITPLEFQGGTLLSPREAVNGSGNRKSVLQLRNSFFRLTTQTKPYLYEKYIQRS